MQQPTAAETTKGEAGNCNRHQGCGDVTHSDLCDIMADDNEAVPQAFPEGSFARIWEQQLDAASCPNKRGMRRHTLMVHPVPP